MNGVINIYKEKGYSSFHIVYELRKLTGEQKVGHTGTLDPDVTGVLPVCIGKATKLVGQLTDTDKIYRCRMLFGRATDTQDISGQVLQEMPAEELFQKLYFQNDCKMTSEQAKQRIHDVILSFVGESEQVPPMYSALKKDGAKLVNLARRGIEVERESRRITIYSISEITVDDDLLHAAFTVHCSRGTYIRTLCEDIGKTLEVPACMEELERTYAAGLGLDSAITIDQAKAFAAEGTLEEHVLSPDRFLDSYPPLEVTEDAVRRLIYGNYLYRKDLVPGSVLQDRQIYRIYDQKGLFYAIYRYDGSAKCCKCIKMFY